MTARPDDDPLGLAPTTADRTPEAPVVNAVAAAKADPRADAVAAVDIAELCRTHWLALVRLAVLFVDDTASAEDAVQDAFTALYRRRTPLRDPNAALGYLRVSVVNGCRSMLRRRRTRRSHRAPVEPVTSPAADSALLLNEDNRLVLEAVRSLPRRQREVLLLRYWSDFSEADIARTLGVSAGTVKSAASRGLDRLEKLLGETR